MTPDHLERSSEVKQAVTASGHHEGLTGGTDATSMLRGGSNEDVCEDCGARAEATVDRGGEDRLCGYHAERAASKGYEVEWDPGTNICPGCGATDCTPDTCPAYAEWTP